MKKLLNRFATWLWHKTVDGEPVFMVSGVEELDVDFNLPGGGGGFSKKSAQLSIGKKKT